MGRFLTILPLAFLLAACAREEPLHPRMVKAAAAFSGPEATAIEVRVFEIPPGTVIERVLLAGPEGARVEAPELIRSVSETAPGVLSRPSLGIAVTGGSSSGVKPAVSLDWHVTGGGPGLRSRQVRAQIALPEPAAYRATARQWRIEVHYTDVTGQSGILVLPTPRVE